METISIPYEHQIKQFLVVCVTSLATLKMMMHMKCLVKSFFKITIQVNGKSILHRLYWMMENNNDYGVRGRVHFCLKKRTYYVGPRV